MHNLYCKYFFSLIFYLIFKFNMIFIVHQYKITTSSSFVIFSQVFNQLENLLFIKTVQIILWWLFKVDGTWSVWSDWTECTLTCGNGTKLRNRSCDFPDGVPQGNNCLGAVSETDVCNTDLCPSKLSSYELLHNFCREILLNIYNTFRSPLLNNFFTICFYHYFIQTIFKHWPGIDFTKIAIRSKRTILYGILSNTNSIFQTIHVSQKLT
jgi:hypothetical protein